MRPYKQKDITLKESTVIKLCRRATKKNPKGVRIADMFGCKTRYLETTHGLYRVEFAKDNSVDDIAKVPYVGF